MGVSFIFVLFNFFNFCSATTVSVRGLYPVSWPQPIQYTAQVNPPPRSGTVSFFDNGTLIGTAPIKFRKALSVAQFTQNIKSGPAVDHLVPAVHEITAKFNGVVSSVWKESVFQGKTKATLKADKTEYANGDTITLTASVKKVKGFGKPTVGHTYVQYKKGGTPFKCLKEKNKKIAKKEKGLVCHVKAKGVVGKQSFTFIYFGDNHTQFGGSQASVTVNFVQRCPTSLPPLANALTQVTAPANDAGKTWTYVCNNGFSSPPTITCQGNNKFLQAGTWTTPSTQCIEIQNYCPAVPSVTGASSQNAVTFTVGASYTYTCSTGYQNPPTVTCQGSTATNGAWSITTGCTAVPCPSNVPTVTNSGSTTTSGSFGTTFTYTCTLGYQGTVTSTCQANGQWSTPSGSCTAIPNYCPTGGVVPTALNAISQTVTAVAGAVGSTLTGASPYTCNFGYNGPPVLTCVAGTATAGVWALASPTSGCQSIPNYCPAGGVVPNALNVLSQTVAAVAGAVGSTLTGASSPYTCNFGYNSPPVLTCVANTAAAGVWALASPTSGCQAFTGYCSTSFLSSILGLLNDVPSTQVVPVAQTAIGQTYTLTCDDGFSGPTVTCVKDTLGLGKYTITSTNTQCSVFTGYCPTTFLSSILGLLAGPLTQVIPVAQTALGQTYTLACNDGYNNGPVVTCVKDTLGFGQYAITSTNTQCSAITSYCPVIPTVLNSVSNLLSLGSQIGSIVTYTCATGHAPACPLGLCLTTAVCQDLNAVAGQWSAVTNPCT